MQRIIASFPITEPDIFKQQMLGWANQFSICCFMDNNYYEQPHHSYNWLLAVDALNTFSPEKNVLPALKEFYRKETDWLFGHFNYDLKNEIEQLVSAQADHINFPVTFFFTPRIVIKANSNEITIESLLENPIEIFNSIQSFIPFAETASQSSIEIKQRIVKENYTAIIETLRQHILRGDCYEINFCTEFFAENVAINPLRVYEQLAAISPNPFSCFYKLNSRYLLCASPERYIKKTGAEIISQPIKGTIKRDTISKTADDSNKQQLFNSNKERSENVMVVDLVRNDLSKVCKEGSVTVEELFGIYTFPQLHQMISTIKGELKHDIDLADILQATFPMGSMTGAPKRSVMQLIEKYEQTKRGIFSGAVGYITPQKDFDFNVVIRSIMYNEGNKYLSYQVGSGITFYSNAEQEYEECLLKAKAIEEVLKK